jgi:hypothetical protein
MYRLLYLPTADYVIDGNSDVSTPIVLEFKTKKSARYELQRKFFKRFVVDKPTAKTYIYSSKTEGAVNKVLPKYLFMIVKV